MQNRRGMAAPRPPGRTLVPGLLALALLLSAPPAAGDGAPYGVNIHAPEGPLLSQLLDQVEAAGISWVRIDLGWADVEKERGRDDWTLYDALVAETSRRGVRVFATLGFTPAWATDGPAGSGVPREPAEWAAFCGRAAARYRGRVDAWGIWNEPNLSGFFAGSRQQYIDVVLRPGAAAVHAADPDAKVGAPELSHLGSAEWYRWLLDVLTQAGSSIDVVTHHVYDRDGSGKVNEKLDASTVFGGRPNLWGIAAPSVREVLEYAGAQGKPFWLTETGWASDDKGEAFQASETGGILRSWFARDQPAWVKKVFVYELIDDGRDGIPRWGLLRSDVSRKPSFDTYRDTVAANPPFGDVATDGALVVPSPIDAGATTAAVFRARNSGRTTWSRAAGHLLVPDGETARLAPGWISIPDAGVAPGETLTLEVPLVAPLAPGSYQVAFRLARQGGEPFGPIPARPLSVQGSCSTGAVPELTVKPPAVALPGAAVTFGWQGGGPPYLVELWKGNGFDPAERLLSTTRGTTTLSLAAPAAEATYLVRVASSGPCGDVGPFSQAAAFAVRGGARLVPVKDAASGWLVEPGQAPPPATVRFRNAGSGAAQVRFDVSGPFTITPLAASLGAGGEAEVTVFGTSGAASAGVSLGRVTATWDGGQASAAVTLAVASARAPGLRPVADRESVLVRAPAGTDVQTAELVVTNPSDVAAALVPSIAPGGAWLSVDPAEYAAPLAPRETRRLKLTVDRRLRQAEDGIAPVRTVLALGLAGGTEEDRLEVQVVDAEPGPLVPSDGRGPATASAPSFVVPTVTRATGVAGQRFRSSLLVRNTGADPVTLDLFATPLGTSGLEGALRVTRTLPGSASLLADDVLGTLFGRDDELTAHLELRSAGARALSVRSVTYGEAAASTARFGAEVPAVASGSGTGAGSAPLVLTGIRSDSGFRVNLILAETAGAEARVGLRLLDAAARLVGYVEKSVPAWGSLQASLLPTFGVPRLELASASLLVEPVSGSGRVVAIATVIDNASASFSVLTGRPVPSSAPAADPVWVVPALVHAPGLTGFFTSDLYLTNGGVRSAGLTLTYTYSGPAGAGEARTGFTLAPKAALPLSSGGDAVVNLFGLSAASSTSGTLRVEGSGSGALAARATVTTPVDLLDPARGTMTAEVPAATASSPGAVGSGGALVASVAGLRKWRRERVNLLLSEASGAAARVRLTVRTDAEGLLRDEELPLAPWEKRQLTDLLGALGGPLADRLTVAVAPAGSAPGRVLASVTVIDNATGSSQVVPLVPPGPRAALPGQ